jgi:hypothetical protein
MSMIDPRYRNLKMNIQPDEAQGAPAQPRGAFGGPPKRNWGRKAVLAMKAIAELDPRYRGGFAQQQAQFDAQDQRALQAQKEAERQAMMAEFAKTLTPEQQTLFGMAPDAVIEGMTKQAFSGPQERKIIKGADGFNYYADTQERVLPNAEAPTPEMTPYQAEQIRLQQERLNFQKNKPVQNGIYFGADGSVQIGGPAGAATTRQMAGQDAQQLANARQRAQDLQPVLNTMYAARAELLGPDGKEGTADDLDTGSFAPAVQMGRRLIPGEQPGETRYDNFDALSKEFGIEKLSGIGGNDTERELMTAIQTGANMGAQEGSNLNRLNRQIAVMEFIGESRRNFMSRWQADHGSLSRLAQTGPYAGKTFDEALSMFQRSEAQRQGLLGSATSGQTAPDSMVGVNPQQGDLTAEEYEEYLALQREFPG